LGSVYQVTGHRNPDGSFPFLLTVFKDQPRNHSSFTDACALSYKGASTRAIGQNPFVLDASKCDCVFLEFRKPDLQFLFAHNLLLPPAKENEAELQ
jgi:hypothetical protein